ncbi:serine/threonine-protein kinase [Anaeramoeba flamelloides]|uniref:Serine/threonine-protein kinase n=1 Tax=Anaeramoeba flamelloides TaxID=1746091 RepID=A0ABQ8Y8Y4_9EUKA|nr:serine/threonine-protein kinase [Anaeramoeba flamelloides]
MGNLTILKTSLLLVNNNNNNRENNKTKERIAIKVINLEKSQDDIKTIQNETAILQQCNSPYLIKYYGSYLEDVNLWMIIEFLEGGSVYDIMKRKKLSESCIVVILQKVLLGLEYFHSQGKMHRDIKAENILISGNCDVKICDFGVACDIDLRKSEEDLFVGSPFWMAPEVIKKEIYNEKVDIWSLGVTTIEMAKGSPPHTKVSGIDILVHIAEGEPAKLEGDFSESLKDFVSLCLQKDPEKRPSATDLLRHKLFKDVSKKKILFTLIKPILKKSKSLHKRYSSSESSDFESSEFTTDSSYSSTEMGSSYDTSTSSESKSGTFSISEESDSTANNNNNSSPKRKYQKSGKWIFPKIINFKDASKIKNDSSFSVVNEDTSKTEKENEIENEEKQNVSEEEDLKKEKEKEKEKEEEKEKGKEKEKEEGEVDEQNEEEEKQKVSEERKVNEENGNSNKGDLNGKNEDLSTQKSKFKKLTIKIENNNFRNQNLVENKESETKEKEIEQEKEKKFQEQKIYNIQNTEETMLNNVCHEDQEKENKIKEKKKEFDPQKKNIVEMRKEKEEEKKNEQNENEEKQKQKVSQEEDLKKEKESQIEEEGGEKVDKVKEKEKDLGNIIQDKNLDLTKSNNDTNEKNEVVEKIQENLDHKYKLEKKANQSITDQEKKDQTLTINNQDTKTNKTKSQNKESEDSDDSEDSYISDDFGESNISDYLNSNNDYIYQNEKQENENTKEKGIEREKENGQEKEQEQSVHVAQTKDNKKTFLKADSNIKNSDFLSSGIIPIIDRLKSEWDGHRMSKNLDNLLENLIECEKIHTGVTQNLFLRSLNYWKFINSPKNIQKEIENFIQKQTQIQAKIIDHYQIEEYLKKEKMVRKKWKKKQEKKMRKEITRKLKRKMRKKKRNKRKKRMSTKNKMITNDLNGGLNEDKDENVNENLNKKKKKKIEKTKKQRKTKGGEEGINENNQTKRKLKKKKKHKKKRKKNQNLIKDPYKEQNGTQIYLIKKSKKKKKRKRKRKVKEEGGIIKKIDLFLSKSKPDLITQK